MSIISILRHIFEADGVTMKAIYTPGHTTDHIILHLQVRLYTSTNQVSMQLNTTISTKLSGVPVYTTYLFAGGKCSIQW